MPKKSLQSVRRSSILPDTDLDSEMIACTAAVAVRAHPTTNSWAGIPALGRRTRLSRTPPPRWAGPSRRRRRYCQEASPVWVRVPRPEGKRSSRCCCVGDIGRRCLRVRPGGVRRREGNGHSCWEGSHLERKQNFKTSVTQINNFLDRVYYLLLKFAF